MDLSLNFAAPNETAESGRSKPRAKGGRWTQRMKASQLSRRSSRTIPTNNQLDLADSSIASDHHRAITEDVHSKKDRIYSDPIGRGPPANFDEGLASNRSKRRNTQTQSLNADPGVSPVKRQVISSLFSNLDTKISSTDKQAKPSSSQAVLTPSNAPSMNESFESMSLRPELVAHLIGKMSLSHPTAIQKLAVPFLCNPSPYSKDALLQAQTGSGKTLAYLLPIIQDLLSLSEQFALKCKSLARDVGTLAIILVPTRELANQIFEVATRLLSFSTQEGPSHRWVTPGLLTGGRHRAHEKARLRKGLPLLISTPGRLLDHLEATKAFRIAGEARRSLTSSARNQVRHGGDSEDEFAIEDQAFSTAPQSGHDLISSDEDFENLPVSRSHRANAVAVNRVRSGENQEDSLLGLRWLVLDEADRLMDMGFEPQISSIVKLLDARFAKRRALHYRAGDSASSSKFNGKTVQHQLIERRTILCSATVEENVERLAKLALKDSLLIKAENEERAMSGIADPANESGNQPTSKSGKYAPPSQLIQHYAVVPPKLRFVALIALLRRVLLSSNAKGKKQKVLVFVSCTDAVDFLWLSLAGMQLGRASQLAESNSTAKLASMSALLPGIPIYRLHGSLDLQTRLTSLQAFSGNISDSAVLFCTSVAARGLDVRDVSCVLQYDLPTEGGVNEYIHRVGRTARAGQVGQAWAFLLPSEIGWIEWAESGMSKSSAEEHMNTKLVEIYTDDLLKTGFGGVDGKVYETRATDVQMSYERWVVADEANASLARRAFSSHIRAYATHPSDEKRFFHVKNLHLGHLAKAFGLREAPAGIGAGPNTHSKILPVKSNNEKILSKHKRKLSHLGGTTPESSDEEREKRKPAISRSGRALQGKGLHGPNKSIRSDFNIADTVVLENMLNRKRKKVT